MIINEIEPCEDEYIKVPKKALKYGTAGMVAYNIKWLKEHFDIERAVICGEQEPCEDCISRQAVDEIKELMTDINGDTVYAIRMSYLRQLPPVNLQEPKTGHWIYLKHNKARCSECEDVVLLAQAYGKANYCPNCGAKMESEG